MLDTEKQGTVFLDKLPGIGNQRDEPKGNEIGNKVNKNGRLTSRNDCRGIEFQRQGVLVSECLMQSLLMSLRWEVIK